MKNKKNARELREKEAAQRKAKQQQKSAAKKKDRAQKAREAQEAEEKAIRDRERKQNNRKLEQAMAQERSRLRDGISSLSEMEIDYEAPFTVRVTVESPLHLGSGQADVNVDAEVIHDDAGLPYFPAKRFKGLLYESALETVEMSELSGLDLVRQEELDALFQHGGTSQLQLVVPTLRLPDYEQIHEEWTALFKKYPEYFQPQAILESYTSLRYQTQIDRVTGIAAEGSLHNMRVVEPGICFIGEVALEGTGNRQRAYEILALALRNLHQAGLKRSRGFGRIRCEMLQQGKDILRPLLHRLLNGKSAEGGKRR